MRFSKKKVKAQVNKEQNFGMSPEVLHSRNIRATFVEWESSRFHILVDPISRPIAPYLDSDVWKKGKQGNKDDCREVLEELELLHDDCSRTLILANFK